MLVGCAALPPSSHTWGTLYPYLENSVSRPRKKRPTCSSAMTDSHPLGRSPSSPLQPYLGNSVYRPRKVRSTPSPSPMPWAAPLQTCLKTPRSTHTWGTASPGRGRTDPCPAAPRLSPIPWALPLPRHAWGTPSTHTWETMSPGRGRTDLCPAAPSRPAAAPHAWQCLRGEGGGGGRWWGVCREEGVGGREGGEVKGRGSCERQLSH